MTTNLFQNQRMEGERPREPHEHANFSTVACGSRGRSPSMRKGLLFITTILGVAFCHAQGFVVHYGTDSNALHVVFEDTNLSVSNQTAIVTSWIKGKRGPIHTDRR